MERGQPSLGEVRAVAGSPPAGAPARFTRAGLVAIEKQRGLVRWRDLDQAPAMVWRPPRGQVVDLEVAPAGDAVAVLVRAHGEFATVGERVNDLWLIDPASGGGRELVHERLIYGPLVWAPAGDRVAACLAGPSEVAAGGGTHPVVVAAASGAIDDVPGRLIDCDPFSWSRDGLLLLEYEPLGKLRRTFLRWRGGRDQPTDHHDGPSWTSSDLALHVVESPGGVVAERRGARTPLALRPVLWLESRAPWVGPDRWFYGHDVIDLHSGAATRVTEEFLVLETASDDGRSLVFVRDDVLLHAPLHEAPRLVELPLPPPRLPAGLPEARTVARNPRAALRGLDQLVRQLSPTPAEIGAVAAAWLAAAGDRIGADHLVLAEAVALTGAIRRAAARPDSRSTRRRMTRGLLDLARVLEGLADADARLAGLSTTLTDLLVATVVR